MARTAVRPPHPLVALVGCVLALSAGCSGPDGTSTTAPSAVHDTVPTTAPSPTTLPTTVDAARTPASIDASDTSTGPDATDTAAAWEGRDLEFLWPGIDEALPAAGAEGPDRTLGESPDTAAAAAITTGLGRADVDLTGVHVSVLPVSRMHASLLVCEVTDEAASLLSGDGDALLTALLDLPEIDAGSIVELVTIYRGTDDEGSFTMTFTVPIAALRVARETGEDPATDVLVQVDRRP